MDNRLDEFIRQNSQELTDSITKQVLFEVPGWREIPLRKTLERIEKFLFVLGDSIRQDNPNFLITYLNSISVRRIKEGVTISALHGLMDIAEARIIEQIHSAEENDQGKKVFINVIKNALASAKVTLSIAYIKKDQEG